jgi:hypothetical protein
VLHDKVHKCVKQLFGDLRHRWLLSCIVPPHAPGWGRVIPPSWATAPHTCLLREAPWETRRRPPICRNPRDSERSPGTDPPHLPVRSHGVGIAAAVLHTITMGV